MTLHDCLEEFIKDRQLRGLAETSIEDYRLIIGLFLSHVGNALPVACLERSAVDNYISHLLRRKDITRTTAITYIRNMKIFLRFLEAKGYASVDSGSIHIPKIPKKNVPIYSDEDIMLIYKSVQSNEPWLTYRNYCIISLMLDSGLRQAETCSLSWSDFQKNFSYAKVLGKGSKERIVPIGKLTAKFLDCYRSLCPFSSDFVLVTADGSPLSCDAVKHMMYRLNRKLPFDVSSHKLRHNFATNYCLDQYEKSGKIDIYRLMVLLGHEDIATTRRYLHIANSIIAAQENISHLDRFLDVFLEA